MRRRLAALLLVIASTSGLPAGATLLSAAEPADDRPQLELIGGLTAAQLITGQTLVESMARGLERDAFTAEEVQIVVMMQMGLIDAIIPQMEAVADDEQTGAANRDVIDQAINILASQKRAARRLMDFLESGEQADLKAFYTASKRVKSQIQRFVGDPNTETD